MKKTLVLAALALASVAASAGVTGTVSYDYDRANNGQGLRAQHEALVGASYATKLGTVDAGVIARRVNTGVYDDALGFELGYSNGLKLGPVAVTGRAAYGRVNQVAGGNTEYYSLAAEGSMPVASNVSAFVGYRHRNGLNADTAAATNRFTVGADVALSKQLSVRAGYAFTKGASVNSNGLTTAVSYKF